MNDDRVFQIMKLPRDAFSVIDFHWAGLSIMAAPTSMVMVSRMIACSRG